MSFVSPNARFKVWILGTDGRTYPKITSLPYRSEIIELAKLKAMVSNWRSCSIELAIIYDLRRTDDQGQPLEIGRYQNNRFEGI